MTPGVPGREPAPGMLVATDLRTAAGSPLPVEVTVTNTAPAARVVAVGAIGVDASWLPPITRTPVLAPGQSVVLTLVLSPALGTVPAQYPLAFTAQALDPDTGRPSGAPAQMVDSVLVVNPRNQLSLELSPRSVSTVSSRRVRLTLRNTGDGVARVRLGVQASPKLRVRFRQQEVQVLPGDTEQVRGRVSVSRGRFFGGVEHHSYTVTARGTEAVRHVEGSVTQRAVVGGVLVKAVALLAVLAIWIAAAAVFIPQLADRMGDRQGETTTATTVDDADSGSGRSDDGGAGAGQADGPDGGGEDGQQGGGPGGEGGAQQVADTDGSAVALSGTVTGDHPGGVQVRLEPTSLVDEDAQGGVGVGVPSSQLGSTGMSMASAFLNRAVSKTPPERTATTTADGSWAFAGVKKPGYYLLTFSKLGYEPQSFVVDAAAEAAAEPLEVDLQAGDGRLSGTVTGPGGGKVGAATVTITDGTNTITTSSNSRGDVGRWSVSGLATPGAYVVTASKPGLSAESRMVDLAAGSQAAADLRLRHGVASLVGKVRAVDESGDLAGFGGAEVTVTSEDGEVRTATTLTESGRAARSSRRAGDFVGSYTVPGLEVPGRYVVTFSGPGLQTQTSKVTLKKGQSKATVDSDLTSAAGTVTGRIRGGDGTPLVGAGLTLSNADNTYKTMSTSDPAGSYLFNGVAPGTYALSTQYFGFVTDHVTVTVRAGRTTEVDRRIEELAGGVLAGRSKVQGQVVDAGTGVAIECPTEGAECVKASVFEPDVDTDGGDSDGGVDHTTTFLPGETFTLPDDPDLGLLPGLHTVRVTAPHYEVGSAKVQVPADGTVNVGTIGLYPAPKITGTITTITGVPSGPTCVWAVPVGQAEPTQDCASAADRACTYQDATFELTATEPEPVCAYVHGRGSYSLEVLQHGSYDVYVKPSDANYLAPERTTKVLGVGDTQNYSVPMHRLGTLIINARKPGTSGSLVAAAGVDVTVDPQGEGPTRTGRTNGAGQLVLTGLADDAYDVSATSGGLSDARDDVPIGLDQDVPVELTLTQPVGNVVGRVTANIDGAPVAVEDAQVEVTAPTSYTTGTTLPVTGTATMTTDDRGCFAVQPDPEDVPGAPAPSSGVCVPDWDPDALEQMTFRSTAASSVKITATGYQDLLVSNRQLDTAGLNSFTMEPKPIDNGQLQVRTNPTTSGISWSSVSFVVTLAGGGDFVSATAADSPLTPGVTRLKWNDRRLPAGTARPGRYTVTATAPGYQPATGHVTCDVMTAACTWDDGPLTLVKDGGLTVSAVDDRGDVKGAEFTLMRGDEVLRTVSAADQSSATFTGLVPGATDYRVRIRARGHSFGFVGGGGDQLSSTCAATLTIPAGDQLTCRATLPRLNTVSGVVRGVTNVEGQSSPFRVLPNAQVEIVRCRGVETVGGTSYCTGTDETERFTTTASGTGEFTLTGTLDQEGLEDGTWLLRATAPGFHLPSAPAGLERGRVITDLDGDLTGVAMELYVDLIDVTVSVADQVGPVPGATVTMVGGGFSLTGAPVSGTPGSYVFENVVPRAYNIEVSKPGYIGTGQSVRFDEGQASYTVDLRVVHGSSNAGGVVAGGIQGVAVRLCADEACADGPMTGTDGQPLTKQTSATGAFLFNTVPNGEYWVEFAKHGYETQTLGPFQADYNVAGRTDINPTLVEVVRNAEITVDPTWSNDDLSAATVTLSRSGSPPRVSAPIGSDGVAEFSQVPWGCWQVEVTLPTDHYGDVGPLDDTGPEDGHVGACAAGLTVSGDEDEDDPATGTIQVAEGAVAVSVAKTAVTGFDTADDPTSATVTITRAGHADPVVEPAPYGVGASDKVIWLPPGSYELAAAPAATDPFWPAVTTSVTVPATKPGSASSVPAQATLVEKSATLVVTVEGKVSGDPNKAELTLYADGGGAVLPAAYASPVDTSTGYQYTFTLPKGTWRVTADVAGRTRDGTKAISTPTAHALTITVDPPEPDPGDDPDPPDPG